MARTKLVNGVRVNMTPEEEAERVAEEQLWETTVKPIEIRKRQFLDAKEQARSFEEEELDILLAGYFEVKLIRLAVLLNLNPGSVDTPVLDSFNSVFPNRTKLQIAQIIENRAQGYLTQSATALANKIKAELP